MRIIPKSNTRIIIVMKDGTELDIWDFTRGAKTVGHIRINMNKPHNVFVLWNTAKKILKVKSIMLTRRKRAY